MLFFCQVFGAVLAFGFYSLCRPSESIIVVSSQISQWNIPAQQANTLRIAAPSTIGGSLVTRKHL